MYSTSEYYAPVWFSSTHACFIDNVLDVMRTVAGYLCLTPTNLLPILAGIQQAELRRQGATFSQAYHTLMDFKHQLHQLMIRPITARKEKLRSRHLFVPAVRELLNELSKLSIPAAPWFDCKWDVKYSKAPVPSHLEWVCPNMLRFDSTRFGSTPC